MSSDTAIAAQPADGGPTGGNGRRDWAGRAVVGHVYQSVKGYGGALGGLLILLVYLISTQPFFLTKANILNVLATNSPLMLVAVGLTFVILSAGFDLSVGSVMAATGVTVYFVLDAGAPAPVALVAGLATGALLGAGLNGLLIGGFRLNFFVVTLGTMTLISGLVQVSTNGSTYSIDSPGIFYAIGNGSVLGVPAPIWIALGAVLLAGAVLRFTPFGRAVYAVGGNREAARLAGINVTAVLISVYTIASLTAALAGLVMASRLSAASPTAGSTIALTAGAAVLLGGTSFFGGIGGISGTVVGVLLIAVLQNGLGLMGVSSFWQGVVTGTVLIAAVALDRLQSRGRT
ncbi:ABC transporter permease [Micromonospora sp. NPDC047793]|uniref:ABC transporter permease n=1 Tax=Micromonospora sp. NPDC047793 TaxID=3154342 RepID=UPI0033CF4A9D